MITRTRYEVAYLRPGSTDVEETEVEVWATDEMRAELEGRRQGLRGPVVDSTTRTITDLGDARNLDALKVWAALVRLGLYEGKSTAFRNDHCVGIAKVGGDDNPGAAVDPTQPAASTGSA